MRLKVRSAAVAAVSAALVLAGSAAAAHDRHGGHEDVEPVVEGLNGPRGIAVVDRHRVVYAEADGTVSKAIVKGHHRGETRVLTRVPAGFLAPAVDVGRHGEVWILTVGGEPGTGGGTLYRWTKRSNTARPVADIMAYQAGDPDPDDLEDAPEESNPYGVAALKDGSVLVADAAGNDLLRVWPNGHIITVARLKPRVVEMPEGFPDNPEEPLPPPGTPIPSEAVATSVTVGPDGYWYVGELRGFPATPGTSQVWRIKPGSKNAVCDPEEPYNRKCKRYADGFTSIVDLASGKRHSLYVLELVKESWLKFEFGLAEPVGSLYRIPWWGAEPRELAEGQLTLPGAVDTARRGHLYLTQPIFRDLGDGQITRIRR